MQFSVLVLLKFNKQNMKKHLFVLLLIAGSSTVFGQNGLSVGDMSPVFSSLTDDGSKWKINKYLGKKNIVVYFYPAAMTGGCTKQACAYRDNRENLESADVVVVGVSGDKVGNLKLFKQAENLNFTLLSDEKGEIAKAFGVPSGDGGTIKRTVAGAEHELVRGVTTKRWTFVIGKNRKIIYKNEQVNAENDTREVLDFIRKKGAE